MKLAAVLGCTMTMAVLTACTDMEDNPASPTEKPSATDNGKWKVTASHMDTSVRPGNDFYMYCNGGYWKNTTVDDAEPFKKLFLGELADEMSKREEALTLPSMVKLAKWGSCSKDVLAMTTHLMA
jgi:predicted metalloendopeptidase